MSSRTDLGAGPDAFWGPSRARRSFGLAGLLLAGLLLGVSVEAGMLSPATLLPALAALVALGAGVLLVARPAAGLVLLVVLVVLMEGRTTAAFFPQAGQFYEKVAVGVVPVELLILAIAFGVGIEGAHRGVFRSPQPFTVPLLLLVVATAMGWVTGHYGGASNAAMLEAVRNLAPLLIMPWIVVKYRPDGA